VSISFCLFPPRCGPFPSPSLRMFLSFFSLVNSLSLFRLAFECSFIIFSITIKSTPEQSKEHQILGQSIRPVHTQPQAALPLIT